MGANTLHGEAHIRFVAPEPAAFPTVTRGFQNLWLRACGLGGFLLASALALFASFLFGRQAFLNYYAFVAVLLLLAAVVFAERLGDRSDNRSAND